MRGIAPLAIAGALAAGACTPMYSTHGYVPVEEKLAQIQVGADTRGSVQRKIGRPATDSTFGDQAWYYVSTKVKRETYHAAEVVERKVIEIAFDERDVVSALNRYGMEDGRLIDLETRTTPTYGRQLTIIEQLIGNLGAIREGDLSGDN